MNNLAIVIPCFKDKFLRKSLSSLAKQTNHNFTVYIGDDCSPYNIQQICSEFDSSIDIVYKRFDINLGGTDLVAHWERCVKLIKDESWIWVFSDDDVAESTCVEAFYSTLLKTGEFFDVYRFNTCVIDGDDQFISAAKESPEIEDAMSLAYNILLWKRGNSMPDHIFKRSAYEEQGGIVNFIQAQGSDWATSIKYARAKGLYTIAGPKIKWRKSGINISSTAGHNNAELIYGYLQFIAWVTSKFKPEDELKSTISVKDIVRASRYSLKAVIKIHYHGIPYLEMFSVAQKVCAIYNESFLNALIFCLKINIELLRIDFAIWKKRRLGSAVLGF